MDCVHVLERIRFIIRQKIVEFGGAAEHPPSEAMLIRDGFFCGRRFESDGLQAVWFVEENEIKFYDRDGAIIKVLELTPEDLGDDLRKAA